MWGALGVRCAILIHAGRVAHVWISSKLLPASVHRAGKEAPVRQKQMSVLRDPASTAGAPISLMALRARVSRATVDLPVQKTCMIVKRQSVSMGVPVWTGLMATRVSVHLSTAEHVASEFTCKVTNSQIRLLQELDLIPVGNVSFLNFDQYACVFVKQVQLPSSEV